MKPNRMKPNETGLYYTARKLETMSPVVPREFFNGYELRVYREERNTFL
jgi:hypothetical protein